jgi:Ca-activated chloride channel family protein
MLVIDVSASMGADDLAPTRLEAAKAAAVTFVERQPPTVRIGLVAFSDGGLAIQQPTSNRAALLTAIERLRPERGTSLGEGMLAALNSIAVDAGADASTEIEPAADSPVAERYEATAILLLSDGENNARPEPREVALAAADRGVRVYAVGVGSSAGTTLQLDGFSVHSRLEAAVLQEIAQLTDGGYYSVEEQTELQRIYDEVGAQLIVRPEETEVTFLFVGAGLLLLLAGGLCSLLWFSRMP